MTDAGPTPQSLTADRRAILAEITDSEFQLWRHNPLTAAFFQHLEDLGENARQAFLRLWEGGGIDDAKKNPDMDPHFLRGEVRTYAYLARITAGSIQAFYRDRAAAEQSEPEIDESVQRPSGPTGY